jgi:DNA-binding transcriptional ArsR family regulator
MIGGTNEPRHPCNQREDRWMATTGAAVSDHDLDQLTGLFRLLSDKTRLNILLLLADGERNVTSLCEQLQLPQPTVSHHLGLLRVNNVIGNRRRGKQVFYHLNGLITLSRAHALEVAVDNYTINLAPKAIAATPPPAMAERTAGV